MQFTRRHILACLFLLTANRVNSQPPQLEVEQVKEFAKAWSYWIKLEQARIAGSIDVPTLRAWNEVKHQWKDLVRYIDNVVY